MTPNPQQVTCCNKCQDRDNDGGLYCFNPKCPCHVPQQEGSWLDELVRDLTKVGVIHSKSEIRAHIQAELCRVAAKEREAGRDEQGKKDKKTYLKAHKIAYERGKADGRAEMFQEIEKAFIDQDPRDEVFVHKVLQVLYCLKEKLTTRNITTRQDQEAVVRAACIKANPEIKYRSGSNHVDIETIRLADVLLASPRSIEISSHSGGSIFHYPNGDHHKRQWARCCWNLRQDDITKQNDEMLQFLFDLLK